MYKLDRKLDNGQRKVWWVMLIKQHHAFAFLVIVLYSITSVPVLAGSVEQNGIKVDFQLIPLATATSSPHALRSGENATFKFHISDVSGAPVSGAYPAAWMERRAETIPTGHKACQQRVKTFIENSLFSQPSLNLNVYYVLVMNDDPSISVVDPLFHFGGSNLLKMIPLSSPAYDWRQSERHNRLYITLPKTKTVGIVDTLSLDVVEYISLTVTPGRIELQPDEHYLWVGYQDSSEVGGGVVVINAKSGDIVKTIPTGAGEHDMAFSADNQYAFISNKQSTTVSVIDIRQLNNVKEISTGQYPVAMAYSPAANTLYVAHEGDGSLVAINSDSLSVVSRNQLNPGLADISFAPGGRFALLANPTTNEVSVLDAANNRITKIGRVENGPDQITFSETLAYIRHRGSEIVLMVPFDAIANPDISLQVVDFPGGQRAFGEPTSPAVNIVQAPGENAVLVANPGDQQIYYYKEGMAAPMGSFRNYQRNARALLTIDRTLREAEPGYYQTVAKLIEPGTYDVAFFLDSPRVVHCFSTRIIPKKNQEVSDVHTVTAELLSYETLQIKKPNLLQFRLRNVSTGELMQDIDQLNALAVLSPGIWRDSQSVEKRDGGVYSVQFSPPQAGAYIIELQADWQAMNSRAPQHLMFQVFAPSAAQ